MTRIASGARSTTERYGRLARGFGTHQAISAMVAPGATVLDVGCADGTLGTLLMSERGAVVTGVEPDAEAANRAAGVLRLVVRGDITDAAVLDRVAASGPFDQVVCGDVLEHMVDPAAALKGVARLVAPGGSVIVSIPNVLTASARLRMLAGVWRYDEIGIFDRTHLRFFSVATARELVREAGLHIVEELDVGPLTHRFGRRAVAATKLRPGMLATQVVIRARVAPSG